MSSSTDFYAYGPTRIGLEAVMRFEAVKRWHMISSTRTQTLAEHSAVVALLAFYIARTAPAMAFGPAENVAAAALMHDLPEVFTGDIPSHTKRHLAGVTAVESKVLPQVYSTKSTSEDVALLIKICDLADGIRFVRLHGVDVTADHARTGLEEQFKANIAKAKTMWATNVVVHVIDAARFYAYEK